MAGGAGKRGQTLSTRAGTLRSRRGLRDLLVLALEKPLDPCEVIRHRLARVFGKRSFIKVEEASGMIEVCRRTAQSIAELDAPALKKTHPRLGREVAGEGEPQ